MLDTFAYNAFGGNADMESRKKNYMVLEEIANQSVFKEFSLNAKEIIKRYTDKKKEGNPEI